jgi:hypothetical protein
VRRPNTDISAVPPADDADTPGVDGEAVDLSPPLRFAIRPVTLWVRTSPRPQALRHQRVSTSGLPARVMAHLLGTAVACEALHVHLGLHVYLLVTLGSPLACRRESGRWFPVPGTEKDV